MPLTLRLCSQPDQVCDSIKYNCAVSYRSVSNFLL